MTSTEVTPQRRTAHQHSWQTLIEFSLSREPGSERLAVDRVAEAVQRLNLPAAQLGQIELALAKATLNAIQRSHRYGSETPLVIRVLIPENGPATREADQAGSGLAQHRVSEGEAQQVGRPPSRGWGFFLIEKPVQGPGRDVGHLIQLYLYPEGEQCDIQKPREKMDKQTNLKLNDGSRVAVMGGGPAGSFFSYFLLDMAERVGRQIQVDIYEPRDFDLPGPRGCNMCAGVVSETLVQYLAAEGINLPPTVVERGIDSYVLHMDVGSARIDTALNEKRIGALFRGIGPRELREIKWGSFDNHLLRLATSKGARVIRQRVVEVGRKDGLLQIRAQNGSLEAYDLLSVAVGVNTAALKLFEGLGFGFKPPRTTQCLVREYYLGEEAVAKYVGTSFHAFLLNIPRLEFAAIIPKGDYVTLALLGKDIDRDLLQTFLNDPAVERCLPPGFPLDQVACWCAPRINVKGSAQPFGDRIVFIGDCGVSRLYKDGIGAAYRAAKAAAATAMFQGVSVEDFKRHYWPVCQVMETDNLIGKMIFTIVRQIQKRGFARRAVLRMVSTEQQGKADAERGMSLVMWDMLTGSAPYREIFLRTLHPAFWTRFLRDLVFSLWPLHRGGLESKGQSSISPVPAPAAGAEVHNL